MTKLMDMFKAVDKMAEEGIDFEGSPLEKMLEKGADPNVKNPDGVTLLSYVASRLCNNSEYTVVDHMMDYGVDPNALNADGTTSLMTAIESGMYENVVSLLDYVEPDTINFRDKNGNNALIWAYEMDNPENDDGEIVDLMISLIDAGADMSLVNYHNENVIDIIKDIDKEFLARMTAKRPELKKVIRKIEREKEKQQQAVGMNEQIER